MAKASAATTDTDLIDEAERPELRPLAHDRYAAQDAQGARLVNDIRDRDHEAIQIHATLLNMVVTVSEMVVTVSEAIKRPRLGRLRLSRRAQQVS